MLFACEVEQVEASAGLEDDLRGTDGGKGDVVVGEAGDLPGLGAGGEVVEGPEVVALALAAVGEEVEGVAVPHGLDVVGVAFAQVARFLRLEVEEPDLRRQAAAVALPGAKLPRLGGIGDAAAVGREGGELAVGHRELFGEAAFGGDAEELAEEKAVGA